MADMSHSLPMPKPVSSRSRLLEGAWRNLVIGLIAFLTVVDLFATQAILPSLAKHYNVAPAAMGLAVNASTLGMAVAGLAVAFFSRRLNRRRFILIALCVLAIPTALLASFCATRGSLVETEFARCWPASLLLTTPLWGALKNPRPASSIPAGKR